MIDYCIIGQGVAGSFLAYELKRHGASVHIYDDGHKSSSSIISAGILNPITGKRFAITEEYDRYFSQAYDFYQELEETFNDEFFRPHLIIRMFKNEFEKGKWQNKEGLTIVKDYIERENEKNHFGSYLTDDLGSIEIKKGGICLTTKLLNKLKNYFLEHEMLIQKSIAYEEVESFKDYVIVDRVKYSNLIFAQGYKAQFNPWFDWLEYNSVKGEILKIKVKEDSLPKAIINKGKWMVPIESDGWMCGATYIWDELDCNVSEKARNEILEGLGLFLNCELKVVAQHAAVRPVLLDQKPVLGFHPIEKRIGIFNGLASKGFLMAPLLASQFAKHLVMDKPIDDEVSLSRFSYEKLASS